MLVACRVVERAVVRGTEGGNRVANRRAWMHSQWSVRRARSTDRRHGRTDGRVASASWQVAWSYSALLCGLRLGTPNSEHRTALGRAPWTVAERASWLVVTCVRATLSRLLRTSTLYMNSTYVHRILCTHSQ